MKKYVVVILLLLISGCARYKGWEFVRIENQLPSPTCVYKVQEVCSRVGGESCLNWFKQRATVFDADTVVVKETETVGKGFKLKPFGASVGTVSNTIAEYYSCANINRYRF